jgi:hypothetical protein
MAVSTARKGAADDGHKQTLTAAEVSSAAASAKPSNLLLWAAERA